MSHRREVADLRRTALHLGLACALVAAGALAPLWLPSQLVALTGLVILLRLCWIEDNITNDLYGRTDLPGDYKTTIRTRRVVLLRWFGLLPADPHHADRPAHVIATELRAEAQVWACTLLGALSVTIAQVGPFGTLGNLALGAACLAMALRRADSLVHTLGHCARGRALPAPLLLPHGRRWLQGRPGR